MSQILFSDVVCPNTISMVSESTTAFVGSVRGFVSLTTTWTCLGSIGFVNLSNFDAHLLCFVGDQVRQFSESPLMQLLIAGLTIVNAISDTCKVS